MKKWLRWQGLVLFGVITALVIIFWYFLADRIVKRSIETTGTRVVGAQVELSEADVRLFPLGITLTNLQVTNPDRPMTNAVQAGRMEFSLNGLNLLKRKIIIESMSLAGIRFNTPRKKSGAVDHAEKEEAPSEAPSDSQKPKSDLPSFQLPDIDDILARETLASLEQIKHVRSEIEAAKVKWQKQLAEAPDQKTFETYQDRAKKLQKGIKGLSGALTTAKDLKDLQKDISTDLKTIKQIQKDFNRDTSNLKEKIKQLRAAPRQDIDRIMKKYSLSADGLGNVSQLLFGDKIGGYVQHAVLWYGKIGPLLSKAGPTDQTDKPEKPARGKGISVRYQEADPLPDLLAKHADVSIEIPAGSIQGDIQQITTQQHILGLPLAFSFTGDTLKDIQSVKIQGSLDHIDPGNAMDRITATVMAYGVQDLALSEAENLPILLKKGLADLNLTASMKQEMLDADVSLSMNSTELTVGESLDPSPVVKALQNALTDVTRFTLTAKVSGPLDDYKVQMTSDLDRVLKRAVGKQLKNLTSDFQKDLRAGIMAKIKDPMAETSGSMSGLDTITQEIGSRLNLGNGVSDSLAKNLGKTPKLKW